MEVIFTKLIEQLPSAAAIIIVVVYFITYIGKRDVQENKRSEQTLTILTELAKSVNTVSTKQDQHHDAMMAAVSDMRTVTRRNRGGGNDRS
jgi:hypothetical protein